MKRSPSLSSAASLAWITATCSYMLIALVAISSFFAHFEGAISYTTPLNANDFWYIVSRFRFTDLRFDAAFAYVSTALTTAIIIFAAPHRANLLLLLAVAQLIVIPIVHIGLLGWFTHGLLLFLGGTLDGEWFHEGWPIMESVSLWAIVPATIVLRRAVTLASALRRRHSEYEAGRGRAVG